MDRISHLPTAFLRARLDCLEKELEEMPKVYMGRRGDNAILREYYFEDGLRKQHEYAMNGCKGKKLLALCERRKEIIKTGNQIRSIVVRREHSSKYHLRNIDTSFDDEFWKGICLYDTDGEKPYEHNGIRMRSRGEVIVAQVLDSLGLEYKYEIRLQIGEEIFSPDFTVYLPEFKRCFFIEFLGMIDNQNYAYKNGLKIGTYLNAGMLINKDILLFCGTKTSMPSSEEIAEDICALINKYCAMYFV